MDNKDATERSYKDGYEAGRRDSELEIAALKGQVRGLLNALHIVLPGYEVKGYAKDEKSEINQ